MKKKSMIPEDNKTLNNNFINMNQKLENVPQSSLRVKGDTHSKINVLKKIEMAESVDDILEAALNLYINKFSEEKQKEIQEQIDKDIDYKIKRKRKKQSNQK